MAVEPTWLREIEQAVPIAALEQGAAQRSLEPPSQRDLMRAEFEELVKRSPDQVALQVGAWLKED